MYMYIYVYVYINVVFKAPKYWYSRLKAFLKPPLPSQKIPRFKAVPSGTPKVLWGLNDLPVSWFHTPKMNVVSYTSDILQKVAVVIF